MKFIFAALFVGLSANAAIVPLAAPPTLNGIYKLKQEVDVQPDGVVVGGDFEENLAGIVIGLNRGDPIAIEFLERGQVLVSLALPYEEKGKVPEQLILSSEEFHALDLKFISFGDVNVLDERFRGESVNEYSARRVRSGRIVGARGNCVAVVKAKTGFRGISGNGRGMADALLRWGKGYRVVSFSYRKVGTVCSWTGGWHGLGHVGWFDGRCFQPTYRGRGACGDPGRRYRLYKCVARA